MTKSELIERTSLKLPHLMQRDVELAINVIIDAMIHHLARGERIEIRGFGGFSTIPRKARMGRNPKTGESVSLPSRHTVHFKPGLDLRNRVNASKLAFPTIKDL